MTSYQSEDMTSLAFLRRLLYRKLLTLFLASYIIAIFLFINNMRQIELASGFVRRTARPSIASLTSSKNSSSRWNRTESALEFRSRGTFALPSPLSEPYVIKTNHSYGDFIALGKEAFVYSAYVDSRKDETYIRLLALFSKTSAVSSNVYCHFNHTTLKGPLKATQYQLCENHDKKYGGYFYSCAVPASLEAVNLTTVVVSLTKFGPRVAVPLLTTHPPSYKLSYLNSYPIRISHFRPTSPVPSTMKKDSITAQPKFYPDQLSFAICVSPLFGSVSVFRLIEFIELSKLLGAHHLYFYNYNVSKAVDMVLEYYAGLNQITVLPWRLPSHVDQLNVWYHGQLLSNNDCLYRTMSSHDLVSFNDLDEFVVPHSAASTWREGFGQFLKDDQCGFSFQSAFYDPGNFDPRESKLFTPSITIRMQQYSKVRTKVMICPWRVFEVGIHHVSKQNKEEWRPYNMDPSMAYIHHYRRCTTDYSVNCYVYDQDRTIADRYADKLSANYDSILKDLHEKNILRKEVS